MKALILAGGEGQRLRPYTSILPKPLLPVGNRPIIEIIIERLNQYGINEIILLTNYKSELFEAILGNGERLGVKINYSRESKPLGTAGPLKLMENQIDGDFIVINGDVITDLKFNELIDFHKQNNSDITLVTKKEEILLNYGLIKLDNSSVIGWEEKPVIKSEVSAGIYILNKRVLKNIKEDEKMDMPELVLRVIGNKGKVNRFLYSGKWIDVGRIGDYQKANDEALKEFENSNKK